MTASRIGTCACSIDDFNDEMANTCPNDGTALERRRRSILARIFLRRVLACPKCGRVERTWRVPFGRALTFVGSRYSRCIQCGSFRVKRLAGRDRIDSVSTHPLSVLIGLTLAPFYHCNPCRLQYHDWRQIHPLARPEAKPTADAVR